MTSGPYCLSLLGYCLEVECAECVAAQQLRAPADTTTLRGVKQAALGYTRPLTSRRTHFHCECTRHPMCVSGAVSTPPTPHRTSAKPDEIHRRQHKVIREWQKPNLVPLYLFTPLCSFNLTTLLLILQSRVTYPDGFSNVCPSLALNVLL